MEKILFAMIVFVGISAIFALFIPFFVYTIKVKIVSIDLKMTEIIKRLPTKD